MTQPSEQDETLSTDDQSYEIKDSGLNQQMDAIKDAIIGGVNNVSTANERLEHAIKELNDQTKELNKEMVETMEKNVILINNVKSKTEANLSNAKFHLGISFVFFSIIITALEILVAHWLLNSLFTNSIIYYLLIIFILQELGLYLVYEYEKGDIYKLSGNVSRDLDTAKQNSLNKLTEKHKLKSYIATSKERTDGLKLFLGNLIDYTKEYIPVLKKGVETYELRQKKEFFISKVRYSLIRYNFKIDDILERRLRPFEIIGDNEEFWLEKMTINIGSSIGIRKNVIGVILSESGFFQNNLSQFWLNMEDIDFRQLSSILINQNVIISKKIRDDKALLKLVELCLKESKEGYSLNKVQKSIIELENKFESFIEQITEISSLFYLDNVPSSEEILKFIPSDLNNLLDELYDLTSKKSKVEKDIILLFRASLLSPNHGKLQRARVLKLCELSKLAIFVASRPEISYNLDAKSIIRILENPDWIDFFDLKGLFKKFYETNQVLVEYVKFLKSQDLKSNEIIFSELAPLLPNNFDSLTAETFEKLGNELIDVKNNSFKFEKSSINLAALSVFLYELAPFRTELFQIYKRSASNEQTTMILYCRARLMDDAEIKDKVVKLNDAVIEAQSSNEVERYAYLLDYQTMLRSNHVYSSIKIMVEGRVRDASRLITENSWSKYYSKLQTHIKTFFNAKIVRENVPSLLKYNLVKAYLITSPSQFALMEILDSKNFMIVIGELEKTDSDYAELHRIKKGTGNSTRVLVISSKVDFEKFRLMLDRAIHRFLELFPNEIKIHNPKYSFAYVMRLYSSRESMGIIPRKQEEMNSLHSLILESMKELLPSEQMSIVAASRSEGSVELTLNALNLEMLNQHGVDIFEFIDKTSYQNNVRNSLDSKVKENVQKEILAEFEVAGIGELCKHLFKLKSDQIVETRFLNAVKRGTKHISSEKKKLISDISLNLLDELKAIGGMLSN